MTTSESVTPDPPLLLDVAAVARLLGCSPRHIWRLADSGDFPAPLPVGRLRRWQRAAIVQWIQDHTPTTAHKGARHG
jgi:excisionase family DNA binding protein